MGGIDAVVLTGTPADLARRELDPRALAERFPHLIVAVISPFGLAGPRAEWRCCDTVAQAFGGMLFVNGHADEPPLRSLGPQAYHCAGLQAAIGVVLALLARRRSGRGQIVDVSLQESTVGALEHVTQPLPRARRRFRAAGIAALDAARSASPCAATGRCCSRIMGDWTALRRVAEERRRRGRSLRSALERFRAAPRGERARLRCPGLRGRRATAWPSWSNRRSCAACRSPRCWPLGDVVQHPQLWARGFFARDDHGVSIVRPLARAFR